MDQAFRHQVLRAAVRDRAFLKAVVRDLLPSDFPEVEEQIVVKTAIDFYDQYSEPVGAMLRSWTEEASKNAHLGVEARKHLRTLVDTILGAGMELVSVKALQDRIQQLRKHTFYTSAVEQVITAHQSGKLDVDSFAEIVERASRELATHETVARDYIKELEKRIQRRALYESEENKFPLLMIEPLDRKIRSIARGHLGAVLAPYSSGKGQALNHLAIAYAMQGFRVLKFDLEDPPEEVEDRLDANLCGVPKNKLFRFPNRLRKRFKKARTRLRAKIRLVDATDGGWSVTRIQRTWETLRQEGFIADVIIIDYDDELDCEKQYKGENSRRHEFAEIYKRLRKLARDLDIIVWTAMQGTRDSEGRKVISGKYAAEDISKIRKCFFVFSIGSMPDSEHIKHLFVVRHRLDKSRFGVDICSNFDEGVFCDPVATHALLVAKRKHGG